MDTGGILASFGVAAVVYLLIAIALIALEIWVAYTIIWRAVRRGLREFHGVSPQSQAQRGPRDW